MMPMKRHLSLLVILSVSLLLAACASKPALSAAPPGGTWSGDYGPDAERREPITVDLRWEDANLRGVVHAGTRSIDLTTVSFKADTGAIAMEFDTQGNYGQKVHYVIERVCGGVVRPEAYTDSRGNFSFIVGGQNAAVFADASVGGIGAGDPRQQGGVSERSLTGCEIRANLPGFLSDSIILGFRGALDDPEIGVIHLQRLANVEGYTFSLTTALAPKEARRAYEKGLDGMKKKKWADAERDLSKSVQLYPKYAVAWYELGRTYQQQKKLDEANHAHLEAIKIDSKFISPYGELATMAAVQQKWDDVDQYTSQMLRLNPYVVPEIYFYSAVANYNLQKLDLAERRAREAAKADAQHRIPRINHLLGAILADKHDYKGAAESLQIYLKYSPDAKDADAVKQQLAEIEKALAGER